MEEIDFCEFLNGIWKRKIIIIILTILALIIGILYSQEKIEILPITKKDSEDRVIYARTSFTVLQTDKYIIRENTVNTYLNIMTSTYNMNNIIEKYDLNMKPEELIKSIYICRMDYSEIIELCIINEKLVEYSIEILNDLLNIIDSEIKNIYDISGIYMIENPYILENSNEINNKKDDKVEKNFKIDIKKVIVVTLGGTIIGFVIVAGLETLDGSIKSENQINNLRIDNLAIVGPNYNDNSYQEEFRKIKLNLKDNKVVLFTNLMASKNNEIVDGIIRIYYQYGKNVVLVDITNEQLDIFDIKNNDDLKYELKKSKYSSNDLTKLFETEKVEEILEKIKKENDIVIIKGNNILESVNSLEMSKFANGIVCVVEERKTQLKALEKMIRNLEKIDVDVLGTIVSKI